MEVRQFVEETLEAMKQSVHRVMEQHGMEYSFLTDLQCEPFSVADSADIVMHAENAARKAGLSFSTGRTGAGSDAQVFAARGAKVVKIATGMQFVHSCRERVRLTDMEDCVRYVCALAGRYDCL